ncbi:MAG: DUF4860 domain-containing protein [Eubacteriaceae bacterium]|nr:MAG: DUF4860 domain-containing protein [Eubacteriaceae bacterium]
MKKRTFSVNVILPILLFGAFALLAMGVAVRSVRAYKQEEAAAKENESARVISAYIRQKVRQADPGTVAIGQIGRRQALVIAQTDGSWTTYIYQYRGQLMEQAVQPGAAAAPEGGTAIAEAKTFKLKWVSPGLLQVTSAALGGRSETAVIAVY